MLAERQAQAGVLCSRAAGLEGGVVPNWGLEWGILWVLWVGVAMSGRRKYGEVELGLD